MKTDKWWAYGVDDVGCQCYQCQSRRALEVQEFLDEYYSSDNDRVALIHNLCEKIIKASNIPERIFLDDYTLTRTNNHITYRRELWK